ncbi:hypothetical protein WJX74_009816 [Apatococcus lobatus]|uniref:RING-type domain-containing protein n=1 Tax=Apatococcus lobatus TaxID=904363 RepID=A0AAW1R063_9CHLO
MDACGELPEGAPSSAEMHRSVDALFPPHWRGKLLDAKQLDSLLQLETAPSAAFFEELQQQIQRVSKTFNKAASKVSRAARCLPSNGKQVAIWFWSKWRAFKVAGSDTVIPLTSNSVTEEAAWCYTYAQVNKVLLERILQQHDLLVGGDEGKRFYKDAHCVGEANVLSTPSFLHSPWQEELLALQSRVSQQTTNREAKEAARALKRQPREDQKPQGIVTPTHVSHKNDEFEAKCAMPNTPSLTSHATSPADPVKVAVPGPKVPPLHLSGIHSSDSNVGGFVRCNSAPQPIAAAAPSAGVSQPAAGRNGWSSRPVTADSAVNVSNSIPPTSVRAERDASMRRGKGPGAGLPVDVGDGVPARKKLLRKKSEPYIPRRACLREVRQRLHVSHDAADPLCKEDDLICSICLDVFCQPVGLACGHVFCMSCLVDAMKGSVLLRPQVLPRQGRCPECRQQNVCRTCVELRELDKLVQLRHPEEHQKKLNHWEWRLHLQSVRF